MHRVQKLLPMSLVVAHLVHPSLGNAVYYVLNDNRCLTNDSALQTLFATDHLRCSYQCYVTFACAMFSLNFLNATCALFGATQANDFGALSSYSGEACSTWVKSGVRVGYKSFAIYASSGNFTVPENVFSLAVLAVGGGGRGGDGDFGGAGSGFVAFSQIAVTPGQTFNVSIGAGANSNTDGGTTTFGGSLLVARGGSSAAGYNGGSGGSGGGGGYAAVNTQLSGNGGSAGSSGLMSGNGFAGGSGQGSNFTAYFSQFRLNKLSAGMGAAGVYGDSCCHIGGGGGGGVLVNGAGPNSTGAQCCGTLGYCGPGPSSGYGAGGSGSCYTASGGHLGGAGASGLIYIEW